MNEYVKELESVKDENVDPGIELTKIRPIHKECSLASAQAAIHASLQPAAASIAQASVTITVQSVKAKDTFAISGTSEAPKLSIITKPITATGTEKPEFIAQKLYLALEGVSDFQNSGVAASIQGNIITLTGGSSITWKSTGTGALAISSGTNSKDTNTATGTPSKAAATTSSKTPGHGVGK